MATVHVLAPGGRWVARDQIGESASRGRVFTYEIDGVTPKATYKDPSGLIPNTNPVQLDEDGGAVIYWRLTDGEPLYTIRVIDADGQVIYTQRPYPVVTQALGGGSVITNEFSETNFFTNEQFTFWRGGTAFADTDLLVGETPVADNWFYERGNTDSVVTISRESFDPGTVQPPGPPIYYIHYESDGGGSDTSNRIKQKFSDVNILNQVEVAVTIWARTSIPATISTVTVQYEQFFGTGGAPDPTNIVNATTFNINDQWTEYNTTFTIDSTAGASLGTNGDAYLSMMLQYQINQPIEIDITTVKFNINEVPFDFPYETPFLQESRLLPFELKQINDDQGSDAVQYTAVETVRDALDRLEGEAFSRNLLIGWYFPKNPRQLGITNDSTTFALNNNNTYIMDQTILLSDGNDIVDVSFGNDRSLKMTVNSGASKFGIFQKVTNLDSLPAVLQGVVSLRASINQTSANSNTKIAVVQISGTRDQQGTDIVDTWNADDTPPTLAAGWSYLTDPNANLFGQITGTTPTFTDVIFEDLAITDPSIENIGVFIWSDTINLVPGDEIEVLYGQLNLGDEAAPIEIISDAEVLAKCQQFIFKTYISSDTPDVLPADSSPAWNVNPVYSGESPNNTVVSPSLRVTHYFPVSMFSRSGSLSGVVYNPYTGSQDNIRIIGNYYTGTSSVNYTHDRSATVPEVSETYITFTSGEFVVVASATVPDAVNGGLGEARVVYQVFVTAFVG